MTGEQFVETLKKLQDDLKKIGSARPRTVAELSQALTDLQKDAPADATAFSALTPADQDVLAGRLARIQQGAESFADGSTDPSSIMYKKLASNLAVWSQGLLAGALTLALIFSVCEYWERATKGMTACNSDAVANTNPGAKPESASAGGMAASEKPSAPAGTPGAASAGAAGAAANQPNKPGAISEKPAEKPPETAPDKSLEVTPTQITLTTCASVPLRVSGAAPGDIKWPEDVPTGSLSKDGIYTAPSSIAAQQSLRIGASVKAGNQSQAAKATNIVLIPPGGPEEKYVLIMIALMGALGGCLHWISGFVVYVGNREFLRSWIPYYVLMPIEGAALAIIVYMLLRVGILTPTANNGQNTAALNTIGLYSFAGLTGIYSKQALTSLGDVFNTIFKKVQAKDQSKTDPKSDTKATS